jgi:branched-chain amino acid transport system substrate-binding protein
VKRSLRLSAKDINQKGGVGGKKISLNIKNDQGDPTKAVSLLQTALTSGEKPDLVFAGILTSETLAMLPLLTRQKVLAISTGGDSSLGNAKKYPYYFQLPEPTSEQLSGLSAHLKSAKVKKLGIFIQDDAFGSGSEAAVKTALGGSGIDVVTQKFSPTDVDLTGAFQKLLSEHPDAVYTDCSGDPCGRILKARYDDGATNVPMIGGVAMADTGLGPRSFASKAANANLQINAPRVSVYVPPSERSADFKNFYGGYTANGYKVTESLYVPALVWDGMHLVQAAAKKSAGKTDASAMAKGMTKIGAGDFLCQDSYGYTPTSHSPVAAPHAFKLIPSSPTVGGLYKPASS